MGKLEVVFTIGLAYSLAPDPDILSDRRVMSMRRVRASGSKAAVFVFVAPPNTVRIDFPIPGRQFKSEFGGILDQLVLSVETECPSKEEGRASWNDPRLNIQQDGARALFDLFDMLRLLEYRDNRTVHGYPILRAPRLEASPLVGRCEAQVLFDSEVIVENAQLNSSASIQIRRKSWEEGVSRMAGGAKVPVYLGFALDAMYFATFDSLRAIIMAAAAWEIALREYVRDVVAKADSACRCGPNSKFAYTLKTAESHRGLLFVDAPLADRCKKRMDDLVRDLPRLRAELLHNGIFPPQSVVRETTEAVLQAIDWLFQQAASSATT
jgi:hypothetical protein